MKNSYEKWKCKLKNKKTFKLREEEGEGVMNVEAEGVGEEK